MTATATATATVTVTVAGPAPIAIVVVTRNCLAALESTLDSMRALDDARVCPILIDGASTDGTAQCIAALHGWAHHAVSEPDRGIYDAMNKGWAAAPDNAHILFLGAGDRVLALPPAADLIDGSQHPRQVVLGATSVGDMRFHSRWGFEMRLRNTAHHQALLVHKSTSLNAPFDTALRVYGDWDFNLRLLTRGISAHRAPHLLTWAAPGGVSWRHDLAEIRRVATRHGGWCIGTAAYALNGISRWRRDRAIRAAATPR